MTGKGGVFIPKEHGFSLAWHAEKNGGRKDRSPVSKISFCDRAVWDSRCIYQDVGSGYMRTLDPYNLYFVPLDMLAQLRIGGMTPPLSSRGNRGILKWIIVL